MSTTLRMRAWLVLACVAGLVVASAGRPWADGEAVGAATGGAITGVVTDGHSREGIAGVTVLASSTDAPPVQHAVITDDQGRYRIADLPPGQYVVTIYLDDYQTSRPPVVVAAGREVAVHVRISDEMRPPSEPFCTGPDDCPGWQVCSVVLGDCDSAMAPFEICTGVCTTGTFHLGVRAAGVIAGDLDAGVDATAAFSLELLPPLIGHRLSLAADRWTEGTWRLGAALWGRPGLHSAASLRIDACHTDGAWHLAGALRIEGAPRSRHISGPWRSTSIFAELGLVATDDPRFFVSLGVAGWLRWPGLLR